MGYAVLALSICLVVVFAIFGIVIQTYKDEIHELKRRLREKEVFQSSSCPTPGIAFSTYRTDKFKEIPTHVLIRAIEVVNGVITEEDRSRLIQAIRRDPENWYLAQHHFWGMAMRNHLRQSGLSDDLLPDKNWDDYYAAVVEAALGQRELPKV